jgi:hypothetical protein
MMQKDYWICSRCNRRVSVELGYCPRCNCRIRLKKHIGDEEADRRYVL